jgi:hypothetical protein
MFYDRDSNLEQKLSALLALVNKNQSPNINDLWLLLKDIEAIKLNIKFFGYELAESLSKALPKNDTPVDPGFVGLASKPSTQNDIESNWLAYWANKLKIGVIYHRKIWELCYVLQALAERGALQASNRGLGFGCGQEPIPSLLASMGIDVTVTDLEPEAAQQQGWADTNQHTSAIDLCFRSTLVKKEVFRNHVELKYVNMNHIPEDLVNYNFCWSICALEHLGSIANGLDFIENSLKTLVNGGIAVHTTEFNFSNDEKTIDNWPTVLFQRGHFVEIARRLRAQGHVVAELDFDVGDMPMDRFIDLPPYFHDFKGIMKDSWARGGDHLKVMSDGFPSTCFGLIIQKGA